MLKPGSSATSPVALLALALACSGKAETTLPSEFDAGQRGDAGQPEPAPVQCAGLPSYLASSCDCSSSTPDCFELPGVQVCGSRVAPDATSCSRYPSSFASDECGCDGLTCPAGQHCRTIKETVSGGWYEQNRCVESCQTDADCDVQESCWPNRFGVNVCITPECRSDADCTEDACGHCVLGQWQGFQGAYWRDFPRCVYEGPRTESTCGGMNIMPMDSSYYYYGGAGHTCHAWTYGGG